MSFGILPGVTMRQIHASKGPQYRQHVRHTSWVFHLLAFFGGRSGPILTGKNNATNGHLVFQHWRLTIQQASVPRIAPKVSFKVTTLCSPKQSLNTVVPKNQTRWVSAICPTACGWA